MIVLREGPSHPTTNATAAMNRGREPMNVDPIDLPDGTYQGLFYAYCLEIDGKTYKTRYGVRCTREHCGGSKAFRIVGGAAYKV